MWVYVTVHVLSLWLVTCVNGKDSHHFRSIPHTNFSHPSLETNDTWTQEPDEIIEGACRPPSRIYTDYTHCGEGYCRCQNHVADCSRHFGKLSYVPALPANISVIIFVWNRLTAIEHDDFFQNVTSIVSLDLGYNGLSSISKKAFRSLVKLRALRMRVNKLNYTMLARVLSVQTNLRLLDLSGNKKLGTPPDGLFRDHPLPRLHKLCLMSMGIFRLKMSVFKPLSKLRILYLGDNRLSRATLIPHFLPQLNELILVENSFHTFPSTCTRLGSFMPNLTRLYMSHNAIFVMPSSLVCLPRLERLECDYCRIKHIRTNAFGTTSFPSLAWILLSNLRLGRDQLQIDRYAFNNSKLQTIILSNNKIDVSKDVFHPDSFAGCPNLTELFLHGNDFSSVSVHKLQCLFHHHTLDVLGLANTNIRHISSDMFANLPNLAFLSLDDNKLAYLPDGVFDKLEYLKQLNLSSNVISVVRETAFSLATRQRLKLVSLVDNPFQCDCDLRWFKQWLTTQPDLFVSGDSYMCDNLPNTTVLSFFVADQTCLWSPAVSMYIIATFILILLPLIAGAVLYRYRWHIRLVMYEAVRGRGDTWRRLQEQDFRYDVFVSYDSENIDWVMAHLMPEMEERMGLRLCLHQRDFVTGIPIVDNIEECVQSSKKIMMLFSKQFCKNHWCQFELKLCLNHVLLLGDSLLVVLLEDIPPSDLTLAMMAVMKAMTYIEWEDEPKARASFWGRMRLALNEILV